MSKATKRWERAEKRLAVARKEIQNAVLEHAEARKELSLELRKDIMGATDREAQVLKLIRAKKLNKEIAWELGIGIRTVKFHVERLLSKFGVRSRHDL